MRARARFVYSNIFVSNLFLQSVGLGEYIMPSKPRFRPSPTNENCGSNDRFERLFLKCLIRSVLIICAAFLR